MEQMIIAMCEKSWKILYEYYLSEISAINMTHSCIICASPRARVNNIWDLFLILEYISPSSGIANVSKNLFLKLYIDYLLNIISFIIYFKIWIK